MHGRSIKESYLMHEASPFVMMWKKIWYFIWHDNSIWSWLVNAALAFLIVKFLIYPGLGLLLGTTHPVVAVVSNSMHHPADFDAWWLEKGNWYEQHSFQKEQFLSWKFPNGFNKGDIIVLRNPATAEIGDVIVFQGNSPNPIIHRVIAIQNEQGKVFYTTKGDANPDSSRELGEIRIQEERVVGKALFRIPYLGWIKIGFTELIRS